MSLATFIALVAYVTDLGVHGVPLLADTPPGVHSYPINALPAGFADWLPVLIGSMAASLAALCWAAYGLIGAIRGTQTNPGPAPTGDVLIDLDLAPS